MIDPVETIETSEELAEVVPLSGRAREKEYRTVLETWRELLAPADKVGQERPSPNWCMRILSTYLGLSFSDMYDVRDRYHAKVREMREIVRHVIATDPECLSRGSVEEDRTENSDLYKNLILLWQQQILQWELEWDCRKPDAAVEIAAMSEVHKLFLGEQGLIQHLMSIGFEFTQDDQDTLAELLEEQRDTYLAQAVSGE